MIYLCGHADEVVVAAMAAALHHFGAGCVRGLVQIKQMSVLIPCAGRDASFPSLTYQAKLRRTLVFYRKDHDKNSKTGQSRPSKLSSNAFDERHLGPPQRNRELHRGTEMGRKHLEACSLG